jgi:hypothetical protein
MRKVLLAMLVVAGLGLLTPSGSSAAPISGSAFNAETNASLLDRVHCVPGWPHHRRGWDGCYRPGFVAPVVPVCRSVRVCGPRGCWWRRRCW